MKWEIKHQRVSATFQSIFIIALLLSGLLIYWLFSPDMYIFKILGINNRNYLVAADQPVYVVIRNYLPDFLWVVAIINTALLLKEKKIQEVYTYILFALPFVSEMLQGFKILPGTFDWYDVLVYLSAYLFYFNFKTLPIMKKRIKILLGPLVVLAFIATIIACATPSHTTKTTTKPGFYGFTQYWNNGNGDINGEVGHSLYVSGPLARCEPGSWTMQRSIISGRLPPGLTLNSAPSTITGIPTERGHWIVKMKVSDVTCEGKYYDGFEQELRFHITGSGKVNN